MILIKLKRSTNQGSLKFIHSREAKDSILAYDLNEYSISVKEENTLSQHSCDHGFNTITISALFLSQRLTLITNIVSLSA